MDTNPTDRERKDLEALRAEAARYPDCATCKLRLETGNFTGPSHTASPNCRSGKRNHCSCDTCW